MVLVFRFTVQYRYSYVYMYIYCIRVSRYGQGQPVKNRKLLTLSWLRESFFFGTAYYIVSCCEVKIFKYLQYNAACLGNCLSADYTGCACHVDGKRTIRYYDGYLIKYLMLCSCACTDRRGRVRFPDNRDTPPPPARSPNSLTFFQIVYTLMCVRSCKLICR